MLKALCLLMLSGASVAASASGGIDAFMQSKKVTVYTDKAELCFADTRECHPVLIGKTTPKGRFDLQLYSTKKAGYGGDVIGKRFFVCLAPCLDVKAVRASIGTHSIPVGCRSNYD